MCSKEFIIVSKPLRLGFEILAAGFVTSRGSLWRPGGPGVHHEQGFQHSPQGQA